MTSDNGDDSWRTFRALVENVDRKFARVRDATAYGRVRDFQKVFKAYMRVWKYQQENRARLVAAGLTRSEIGEIASRIGQLYFGHYLRTSQSRFLAESCVFYEAILNRSYFDGSHLSVRFKELRFYARFLLVAFLLCRPDLVAMLMERFRAVVEESRVIFRETDFKEWGQVIEEAVRFTRADTARSLRYFPSASGSESRSEPYLARFHAKKVLKFQDALLCGFHRKEVKFAEITLDAFRMMQCLECEPAFVDHTAKKKMKKKPSENGVSHSGPSGLIDITVADPTLAPNPRKAVLYRPTVTHLISVMATICEELPPDCVILVYLSASGKPHTISEFPGGVGSQKPPRNKTFALHDLNNALPEPEGDSPNGLYDSYLWFGARGRCGSNNLYPGDFVPFTRRPLFLIIDSDISHAFKAGSTWDREGRASCATSVTGEANV